MIKENKILFQGSSVNYKSYGTGKAVILIHGFGEDGTVWDEQVKALQNNFLLIVPDLPGSGKSTILEKDDVCMDDHAACIFEILQQEKITQCTMIGHSMGGYITLAFAEKFPEYLKAFGLFHSSAYADDDEKIATRKKAILFIKENGVQAFLKTSTPGLFYEIKNREHDIDDLLVKGNNFTAAALIQYYEAMMARPDRTTVLKEFNGSVLFIIGFHDKAVPFQLSLQQTHLPTQSYIKILRNSAHMGMMEEKEKANKSLTDFLQSA
jgi:pimeloyl-ACP methyl ester carboxylesterase